MLLRRGSLDNKYSQYKIHLWATFHLAPPGHGTGPAYFWHKQTHEQNNNTSCMLAFSGSGCVVIIS